MVIERKGFTPGPWEWFNGCSWYRLGRVEDCGQRPLVLEPTIARDGHPDTICSPENRALIAAAPDLYEACKYILAEREWDIPPSAKKVLSEAIAKAEGFEA